jgi:hypothetical protein
VHADPRSAHSLMSFFSIDGAQHGEESEEGKEEED